MRFSFLIALMLPVCAQAGLFAPREWPVEAYDTCLDKVNYEVNLKYKGVKDRWLPNAKKMEMARDVCGVHGKVVGVAPYSGTMDHAVFIVGDQVLDNGTISPDIFNVSDLAYYGYFVVGAAPTPTPTQTNKQTWINDNAQRHTNALQAAASNNAPRAAASNNAPRAAASNSAPRAAASNSAPRAAASNRGVYRVQLSASHSEENLRRYWSSYQNRYRELFDGLYVSVERAVLGEEKDVWYRLRVGPFASKASAKELCAKLATRNIEIGCWPSRATR